MSQKRIGVMIGGTNVPGPPGPELLADIERAEEMGIPAAWLVCGGSGIDSITLFAAAAMRTQRILFGTAIVQTFPRHPVLMAQQAQVLAQIAPGRFRLGIGTGHRPNMEATFGADFRAPLSHLSEYIRILKAILHDGTVDFNGRFYKANVRIAAPVDVPVMASALQPKSFELCGAEADGAISWVCPAEYLRDVALPAMKAGAERAGRPVPPLINGIPVCVHDNPEEVRAAVREQLVHPRLPFYQRMFATAGLPEASNGVWSDAMIDASVLWGSESQVAENLHGLLSIGATEVLACPIPAGDNRDASMSRTLRLLSQVASDVDGG